MIRNYLRGNIFPIKKKKYNIMILIYLLELEDITHQI